VESAGIVLRGPRVVEVVQVVHRRFRCPCRRDCSGPPGPDRRPA
jgi:hypothetical protein